SYNIRRHLKLREENISMGILIHQKFSEEIYNGIASFNPYEKPNLRLDIVEGGQSRATNPALNSKLFSHSIENIDVVYDFGPKSSLFMSGIRRLAENIKSVHRIMQNEDVFNPTMVKLEWLLMGPDENAPSYMQFSSPIILQVKKAMSVEERNDFLYGIKKKSELKSFTKDSTYSEVISYLENYKIPMIDMNSYMQRLKLKSEMYFPFRAYVSKEKSLFVTAWDRMDRPHYSTEFAVGELKDKYQLEEVFVGYLRAEISQKKIVRLQILDSNGAGKTMSNYSLNDILKMIAEFMKQIPAELLDKTTLIDLTRQLNREQLQSFSQETFDYEELMNSID
ncbi:MAG: hypothetical protein VX642_12725, partial [Bdellovibrionota bacterium]|nr:hypothetical protein [Bdellovibrionota bacterium]